MNGFFKIAVVPLLMALAAPVFAQGKYFEVITQDFSGNLYGKVVVRGRKDNTVKLEYKGKSKKQLLQYALNYLKDRPGLKRDTLIEGEGALLCYKDFASIGAKDKCFADLVALTYIYVVPEEGYLSVSLSLSPKIFATIFDAKLKVDRGGVVVSENDVPFNEYKFVQPADGRTSSSVSPNGGLLGLATSRKIQYKLAYPDSIFDPEGKVVNPVNKKLVEEYYDGYINDLKSYLDKNVK